MSGIIAPGLIDADALTAGRVQAIFDQVQVLHNLVQGGNLGIGVSEVIQQTIDVTKHGIALHARLDSLDNRLQSMGSDIEAKLAVPVKDKIDELEF